MPSGKVHDRITYVTLLPSGLGVYAYTHSFSMALLATLGLLFGGLMFGPDLDTKSVQYFRWGAFRWVWWPYQRMFSHRSGWTHGVFLGSFTRLLYFSLVCALLSGVFIALYHTYYQPLPWRRLLVRGAHDASTLDPHGAAWVMAGVWLGGALHSWADWLHSRRPFRRRRRRAGR